MAWKSESAFIDAVPLVVLQRFAYLYYINNAYAHDAGVEVSYCWLQQDFIVISVVIKINLCL